MTLPGLGPEVDVPGWLRDRLGSRCRSCGAAIVWALTRQDGASSMPVDPVPSDRGNVRLWLDGGTLRAVVSAPVSDDPTRWLSHLATCPDASKHRRRR